MDTLAVTIFDLLFALVFLATLGALVVAAGRAVRGRRGAALSLLRRTAIAVVAYFAVVALTSLATPRRYVAIGDEQCSDDWCIAVTGVCRPGGTGTPDLEVTFRLSSRARRVTQRERGVTVYLHDGNGHRYDPQPVGAEAPFDVELAPQQSVTTRRVFLAVAAGHDLGVVVAKEGWSRFPGCFVIADESSLFHRRTVVQLDKTAP